MTPKKAKMTDRKTLQLRDPSDTADAALALKKKGRGWEISEKRLDALHAEARERRRHSGEAHKALAERFAKANFGRYTFKRHAVVGSAILDFVCHNLRFAIRIEEDGADPALEARRDRSLEAVGMTVMVLSAQGILTDMDGVLARITDAMRERIGARRARRENAE